MPSGVAAKPISQRREGPEPDGDSAVQVLAAVLNRYTSLRRLPAAGGEGRTHVRLHAQERARRAAADALWPQARRAAGRLRRVRLGHLACSGQTRAERRGCRARLKAKTQRWGPGAVVSYSGCVSLHRIKNAILLSWECMQSRSSGMLACAHLCAHGFCCYVGQWICRWMEVYEIA
jgi:hypothetical protein